MQRCDRCKDFDDTVEVFKDCPDCGPIPLCFRCRSWHWVELDEQSRRPQ